jgi:hypothetical protein
VIDGSMRLQFTPQRICAGMTLQLTGHIPLASGSADKTVRLWRLVDNTGTVILNRSDVESGH